MLVQDLTLEGKCHHRSPGMEVQRDFLIIKEAFPFCLYDHEISARTTAPDEEVRRLGCRADHHSSGPMSRAAGTWDRQFNRTQVFRIPLNFCGAMSFYSNGLYIRKCPIRHCSIWWTLWTCHSLETIALEKTFSVTFLNSLQSTIVKRDDVKGGKEGQGNRYSWTAKYKSAVQKYSIITYNKLHHYIQ